MEEITITLTGKQAFLKMVIGAAVGFYATKLSDKAFDWAIIKQGLKELNDA